MARERKDQSDFRNLHTHTQTHSHACMISVKLDTASARIIGTLLKNGFGKKDYNIKIYTQIFKNFTQTLQNC